MSDLMLPGFTEPIEVTKPTVVCDLCLGFGTVRRPRSWKTATAFGPVYRESEPITCPVCEGEGRVPRP